MHIIFVECQVMQISQHLKTIQNKHSLDILQEQANESSAQALNVAKHVLLA